MKNVYLFAAIAGAVIPYIFFIDFFMAEGILITSFLAGIFANGAAGDDEHACGGSDGFPCGRGHV